MSLRRNKTSAFAACFAVSAFLSGCGQSIRGELPNTEAPVSSILTPDEAKAAAEALVRAKAERQTADAGETRRQGGTTY